MLKRKAVTIAVLAILVLTALGLRAATPQRASFIDAHSAYTTPADPLPLPISPPPGCSAWLVRQNTPHQPPLALPRHFQSHLNPDTSSFWTSRTGEALRLPLAGLKTLRLL